MRTPIKKFAEVENISLRFAYKEVKAGRLVLTKVGSRTFIDDPDADRWRALAPKVTGKAGDVALQVVEQKLVELGRAVENGQIDRARVVEHLADVARRTGLTHQAA
jgi:hypothetical protein